MAELEGTLFADSPRLLSAEYGAGKESQLYNKDSDTERNSHKMEDREIIELFFARDQQAVAAASDKYKNYCMKIAMNILGLKEDAEECVNDALMKIWQLIPPHEPKVLSAFFGKITRNLAINKRKKAIAEKRGGGEAPLVLDELEEIVSGGADVEAEQERRELAETINAFLRKLPKQKCDIFVCRYWYCDSIKDIASQFGLTEDNVSVSLNRIRKKLKLHLEKHGY